MMSSEEDVTVDSYGVLKKTKRARQRVDAGEPRNSYSSIPNFSSRPTTATILNNGIYGAFFAAQQNHQQQQHNFASSNGNSGAGCGSVASIGGSGISGVNTTSAGSYFSQVGFGPTKMLNELLRSRVKTSISNVAAGDNSDNPMMTIDVAAAAAANEAVSAISGAAYECLNNQSSMNRMSSGGGGSNGNGGNTTLNGTGGGSPPVADMAQHMLRNILQNVGRNKKDMFALERELREASNNNNKSNTNHNNNNNNNNDTELDITDCVNETTSLGNNNNSSHHRDNNHDVGGEDEDDENEDVDDEEEDEVEDEEEDDCETTNTENIHKINCNEINDDTTPNGPISKSLTNGDTEDMDIVDTEDKDSKPEISPCNNDKLNDGSSSERSVSSPESVINNNNNNNINNKEDFDEPLKECIVPSQKSEQKELKRARVENIVSIMRSSPLPAPAVNGCKKRKLYHPQQHDNSVAERYAHLDVVDTLSEDEDENLCSAEIRKKVVEKNALKNQLRTVQEQLAEMQQKYVQLCTRMDQDQLDMDETNSDDVDQDDDNNSVTESPLDKNRLPTPTRSATPKEQYTSAMRPNTVSPAIPKMLSSKFMPQSTPNMSHLNPHAFPLHPNFNGALSFLQHQLFQEQQHAAVAAAAAQNHLQPHHPHHHHPSHPHPHPAFSNAAAMYLGVSQKLLMEQEARLAKEAALAAAAAAAAEHHHHHSQSHPAQPPQSATPATHSHQNSNNNTNNASSSGTTSAKESSSPVRIKNEQSSAALTNAAPSSLSSISSTSSSSSSSSTLSQQQTPVAQTTTKKNGDTNCLATSSSLTSKNNNSSGITVDLEGLADSLKTEISTTLSNLIDTILTRFQQQKRAPSKTSEAEQLNKDLLLASQLLDRKSPRAKVIDRGNGGSSSTNDKNTSSSAAPGHSSSSANHNSSYSATSKSHSHSNVNDAQNCANVSGGSSNNTPSNPENNINALNVAVAARSNLTSNLFVPPKLNSSNLNSAAAAAAIYSSMNSLSGSHLSPFCLADMRAAAAAAAAAAPEQNEALSLVVAPKKKRHKVTDTRITPRTVSRILAQDGMGCPPPASSLLEAATNKYGVPTTNGGAPDSPPPPPPPRSFHLPHTAPMLPVSLPTSVAIPNPSLHESQVFSPYSPFYGQHQPPHHLQSSSPPGIGDHLRDSPPLPHHASMFHPALLAAAQQQQQQHHQQQQQQHQQQQQQSHHQRGSSSPDFMNMLPNSGPGGDSLDPGSECNSMDYDGIPPISSTLSPMHLRKAKLMFFWVRYPTSAVLKMYFPDIRFNKNNTAQLVKWFSNFREFYYIQMEKYARAAIADGIQNADDLHVSIDSDIYRVLNLHYNRNNHIEVPSNFRYVVEQTLKEFFKAIQIGKDQDQSWKKPIYKVIGRLDDPVPEYFKSPNFLEQLE